MLFNRASIPESARCKRNLHCSIAARPTVQCLAERFRPPKALHIWLGLRVHLRSRPPKATLARSASQINFTPCILLPLPRFLHPFVILSEPLEFGGLKRLASLSERLWRAHHEIESFARPSPSGACSSYRRASGQASSKPNGTGLSFTTRFDTCILLPSLSVYSSLIILRLGRGFVHYCRVSSAFVKHSFISLCPATFTSPLGFPKASSVQLSQVVVVR